MTDPKLPRDERTDSSRMKAVLLAVAALAFAAAPLAMPFQGFDPNLFPVPQDNPPVQPAGYAFAIWGPIYAWLVVSAGFGLIARPEAPGWDACRWPLIGSLIVGAAWLGVAQVSALWALLLIWAMLIAALAALSRTTAADRWLLREPVALYAGWLTAASWVSIGLVGAGYDIGMGAYGWAVLCVVGAFATALLVQRTLPAASMYGAAVIWALIGIAVANFGEAWILVALPIVGALVIADRAVRAG